MPLTLDRYTVLLHLPEASEPTEHEIASGNPDRLRAELEGHKRGIKDLQSAPIQFSSMLMWSACLRAKLIPADMPFQVFGESVLLDYAEIEEDDTDGAEPPPDAVRPTPEGEGTGPLSSSSTSSPAPTGAIPDSTPV